MQAWTNQEELLQHWQSAHDQLTLQVCYCLLTLNGFFCLWKHLLNLFLKQFITHYRHLWMSGYEIASWLPFFLFHTLRFLFWWKGFKQGLFCMYCSLFPSAQYFLLKLLLMSFYLVCVFLIIIIKLLLLFSWNCRIFLIRPH